MKKEVFLFACLSLALGWSGTVVAETGPPPDAPTEIEGWDKASEKAQSALKAYYESRRMQAKRSATVPSVPSVPSTGGTPGAPRIPLAPGEEAPEQVSSVKDLQDQPPKLKPLEVDPSKLGSEGMLEKEPEEEAPQEKKEIDSTTYRELNASRGYFINRGGGLQYFERGSETFGEGYLNATKIKRSQIDRISPYRGPARMQEHRSTYREHLSRTGRQNRTRGSYR